MLDVIPMVLVVASDKSTEIVHGKQDIWAGSNGYIEELAYSLAIRDVGAIIWYAFQLGEGKSNLHWDSRRGAVFHIKSLKNTIINVYRDNANVFALL